MSPRTRRLQFFVLVACMICGSSQAMAAAAPAAASKPAQPPASVWAEQEKERFAAWLEKHPADVLIAPFQTNGFGFDPAERLLMATRLADSLKIGLTIADPILTGRALGEGLRRYDPREVESLANRVRARFLITPVTTHDGRGNWSLIVNVSQKDSASGTWRFAGQKTWQSLPLKDEQPPHQAMQTMAPDVVSLLGAAASAGAKKPITSVVAASVAAPGKLPSLTKALAATDGPANIHLAQLAASCYPRTPETGVERAWIRTLQMAYAVPAATGAAGATGTNLPIARALMHLGRRPAALAALGNPRNDAELALREVLNGNLPAASRHTAKITDPVLRLLAQIELRDLRVAYDAATPAMEVDALNSLVAEDSDWYPFLELRVQSEGSRWGVEHVLSAMVRFDPVVGSDGSLTRSLRMAIAQLEKNENVFVELVQSSLAAYDTEVEAEKRSPRAGAATLRWLMLDMFQTQLVTDLLSNATATIDTRAMLDAGHEELASLDPILRGHADFEALRARLEWREYARWRGQQRARWQQLAIGHTRDAYRLAGRITSALEKTERVAAYTSESTAVLNQLRAESFWDWPARITWIPSELREDRNAMNRYAATVANYSTSEFANLVWLMNHNMATESHAMLGKAVAGRFDGSPAMVKYRAGTLLAARDTKAAEDVYRRYIGERPMAIEPYYDYLDMLVSQGRHAEGFQMFSALPAFEEEAGADRVILSNYAGLAAGYFWPIGKFEYAEPLLARSAGFETGSGVSLRSAATLALYRRDPESAARTYMQIARRYSDLDALDDYFKLIFALGRPEEAWRIYKEVRNDGNGGRVLGSIARQVRVTGWSDQQILDWLAARENAALADGTFFYAPRAALGAAIIDRDATVDLAAIVRRFPAPSPYVIDKSSGKVVRRLDPAAVARQQPAICGPSHYGGGPTGGMSKVTSVDSALVYFANGYRALARQQPAEAFAVFDGAARVLELFGADSACERTSYLLPYLALAAGQTKNTAALREYLKGVPYPDRNLNFNLAMAALAAFDSKHRDAAGYLDAALNRWTTNSSQPLPPEYIYADVLERLYTLTRDTSYRDRLVRWVKIRQRVQPSDAWAYAMEYRYTQQASDRAPALGMALYLDPHSATLSRVDAREVAEAKRLLEGRNPFRKTSRDRDRSASVRSARGS